MAASSALSSTSWIFCPLSIAASRNAPPLEARGDEIVSAGVDAYAHALVAARPLDEPAEVVFRRGCDGAVRAPRFAGATADPVHHDAVGVATAPHDGFRQ